MAAVNVCQERGITMDSYCGYCGRLLHDGEVCNCQGSQQARGAAGGQNTNAGANNQNGPSNQGYNYQSYNNQNNYSQQHRPFMSGDASYKIEAFSLLAMIFGIVGLTSSNVILDIIAIVFWFVARNKRRADDNLSDKFALAGLITACIGIIVVIISAIVAATAVSSAVNGLYDLYNLLD